MRRTTAMAVLSTTALSLGALTVFGPSADAGTTTPAFATYAAPASLTDSNNAGEPSVGVNWKTGATLYQAYSSTYKVTFNDATVPATASWANVSAGVLVNVDPILFTDSSVGRTYAGGEAGACGNLFKTDNDGTAWTALGNACAGHDHESIGAGPWHGAAPLLSSYNRAVYYCAQSSTDVCSTSSDGGQSFGAPATVGGSCVSLHGHVKVSADGTAYLPNAHCGSNPGGGITSNNGSSWTSYTIPYSVNPNGFDPGVATTPDNTLYEAWADASNHPMVAVSTNHGTSWTKIKDLSVGSGVVVSTFQTAVAGDNGRVAVSYLGSTTPGDPYVSSWHGVWDLYSSFTYDAGVTWTTVKVSTDPVQRGWMCSSGISCGSGRNLLDFMDSSLTKDGRVVIGYADGCIDACALAGGTEAQSTSAFATISRLSTGKGLYAAYDGTIPNGTPSPTPSASPSSSPSSSPSPSTSPSTSPLASPSASPTGDPDPSSPTLTSGVAMSGTTAATSGTYKYYKIAVPAGKTNLRADLTTTQSCGLLGCNPDLDVVVKRAVKPTATVYDCTGATSSSTETCSVANPAVDWYYIGVYVYSGSAAQTFTIKATLTP